MASKDVTIQPQTDRSVQKRPEADKYLLAETAAEVTTVNWTGGHYQHFGKFGPVNLKTLKLGVAKVLIKKGFKKLALLK